MPTLAGGAGGWLVGSVEGLGAGIAAGVGLGLALSALLRFVRSRPRLRRLYRIALAAHVLFWSFLGVREGRVEPPGELHPVLELSWAALTTFRAGAAEAAFELPEHATLSGWGSPPRRTALPAFGGAGVLGRWSLARQAERPSGGRADVPLFHSPGPSSSELGARALVLIPDRGGPTVAFVRLDLVTSDASLFDALLADLRDLGVERSTLVLSATHTHSGVGGYARDALAQVAATDHFAHVVFTLDPGRGGDERARGPPAGRPGPHRGRAGARPRVRRASVAGEEPPGRRSRRD